MNCIEWINAVVGKPWIDRADGPDSFDCWGLVLDSFRRIDGVELHNVIGYEEGSPIEVAGIPEQASGRWQKLDKYEDGAVFCCYSVSNVLVHVGRVFLLIGSGYHAVHARGSEGKGQVAVDDIRALQRLYSSRIEYYKRVS